MPANNPPTSTLDTHEDLADFFSQSPDPAERADLDDESHQIGARLAEARNASGLTDELAHRLGVDESTMTRWEQGSNVPSGHLLARVAGLLGVSLSWLIIGRGVEPTERVREIHQVRSAVHIARSRLTEVLADLEQIEERLAELEN